jgi:hypothetical protein
MRFIMVLLMMVSAYASAHQWTPTYPKLETSHVSGVLQARMKLFNARRDVAYFTFEVFDKDFNPVKFATTQRLLQLDYLGRKDVDIFIREQDRDKAVYVCSRSKIVAKDVTATVVSSRICSKIK